MKVSDKPIALNSLLIIATAKKWDIFVQQLWIRKKPYPIHKHIEKSKEFMSALEFVVVCTFEQYRSANTLPTGQGAIRSPFRTRKIWKKTLAISGHVSWNSPGSGKHENYRGRNHKDKSMKIKKKDWAKCRKEGGQCRALRVGSRNSNAESGYCS